MITILFDIDGTLIRTGGAGLIAIGRVMKEMFGIAAIGKIAVHGRTDTGILNDLFEQQSLCFDDHRHEFNRRYWSLLPGTLEQAPGEILPGVNDLLEVLKQNENVALGILTGNSQRAAEIKLQHFGLAEYFRFGGYGDHHACRNDVAALARQSAEAVLNDQFDPERLWVVGDTVNDILCARSIESRVLAVETGGGCNAVLAEAQPDCQLESLAEAELFLSEIAKPLNVKFS